MSIKGERVRAWRVLLASAVAVTTLLAAAAPLSADTGPGKSTPGASATPAAGKEKQPVEPVWTGTPGTNLAHDSFGYPWPAAPDCNEGDVSSSGCVNDGLGYFQGQCTSWVAFRLGQRNGLSFHNWFDGVHWGNAVDWARAAKRTGYVRNKVPAVGSVGWYARGHVSYVEEVNSDGSIVISEMNTDGHNGFHVVTVAPGDAGYPDKFIHVADVVPVDVTAPARPHPVTASHVDRGVTLQWKAPADDVGVAGYRVSRNGVALTETTDPSYVDRTASAGQNYRYSVQAYDEAGNLSEPAVGGVTQLRPAPRRGPFLRATEVTTGSGTLLCGRLPAGRGQQVGCRVRTLQGWRVVRTGRLVERGLLGTRAFVGGDSEVWFCRQYLGDRDACTELDLATLTWGFDQVSSPRSTPASAVWVATDAGPARCAVVADQAGCRVLTRRGWTRASRAADAAPGDPLSRAFVGTGRGVAFCRVVSGRATCTTLDPRQRTWGREVSSGRDVAHGRWGVRRAGPVLCPVGGGSCRVVARG